MVDIVRIRTKMVMGFTINRNVNLDSDEEIMGQLSRRTSKIESLPNKNGVLEEIITRA